MSALGHTMASMSRDRNGKPNTNMSNATDSRRTRNGRNGNNGANSNNSNGGNVNAARGGQNITHLLGFTLPPRIHNPTIHSGARRPRRGAGAVPFNKERYVNAQYRFLVKPTGDYTAYFADADIYLNWSDILTVLIPTTSALSTASHLSALGSTSNSVTDDGSVTHEGASCPICLSRPTAPRMTKCGHVYCYPCILHYLTVHDAPDASGSSTPTPHSHIPGAGPRHTPPPAATPTGLSAGTTPKWKRCPVCWDAVYARDLKAVQWWDPKACASEFEQADENATDVSAKPARVTSDDYLCMRLIERPHLTTLALPQSSTWPTASTSTFDQPLIAQHSAPWHFQPDVMAFSKFMLATPDLLLSNLHRDIEELVSERELLQSFLTKDEVGLVFVGLAERKVQEQMEKVMNELDTQSVRSRIGYARKELVEHYEIEKGNRARDEEALSRRQRKRMEREKRNEGDLEQEKDRKEEKAEDIVVHNESEGAEEFLALQASRQGGVVTGQNTPKTDEQEEANERKDGRQPTQKTRKNLNPPAPSSSSFYFYQVSSGQNIFLHPLDIKVLLSAYGSYAAFPRTLQLCIQGADEGSMNEEMRKRCKYLTHLSKGADIVFVEIDWEKMLKDSETNEEQSPISRSVLRMYDQALRQRRNRRRDRERREDRAKLRSEEQERASRPPMTATSIPIGGFGTASRSPALSATDAGGFGSSLGSLSTLSPSLQEALLNSSDGQESRMDEIDGHRDQAEGLGIIDNDGDDHHSTPPRRGQTGPVSRTVWGTPAAKGSNFSHALHNSSRTATDGNEGMVDGPDWDSWLELEEDFIVGARNGNSVREGRGLNRQVRKSGGQQTTTADIKAEIDDPTEPTVTNPPARTTTSGGGGKQQKKKKIVLTSGGGGRGTR